METNHAFRKLAAGTMALAATLVAATVMQAAIAGTASAADTQRAISLHGLDLKNPADVAVLYGRIRKAAEDVCQVGSETGSHLRSSAALRCIDASVDATVKTIDRAELSQYHRQAKAGGAASAGA